MDRIRVLVVCAGVSCCGRSALDDELPAPEQPADAAAPIDAAQPSMDAGAHEAAPRCDAGVETAVALDDVGNLWRYEPETNVATKLGAPSCGDGNVQWTMTASGGVAYIVYTGDWSIYAVDLATLACSPTAFQPNQLGLEGEFGIAATGSGAATRLYVYGLFTGSTNPILAVMDTTSYTLKKIGPIHPIPQSSTFPVNLTADVDGNLYSYQPAGFVQKIDPSSGTVVASSWSPVMSASTWATIAYPSALYLWAGPKVDGYDLGSMRVTSDEDAGVNAVGASASRGCP